MIRKIVDHIKQTFRYFNSNKIMSFASVGVLAACLLIVGSICLISANIQINLNNIESENEIVLFIEDDISEENIKAIQENLSNTNNVKTVNFVSKDEALNIYMSEFSNESELFDELLQNNPLPRYFSATLNDIELFDQTLSELKSVSGIYKIRSQEQLVDAMVSLGHTVTNITVWLTGILLIAALFIIINTIKIASLFFKKQIGIMKLIGATNGYIRVPFVLEGALIGLLAGFLAYIIQGYAYSTIIDNLSDGISFIKTIPFDNLRTVVINSFIVSGVGVGMIGSIFSIRKYSDV